MQTMKTNNALLLAFFFTALFAFTTADLVYDSKGDPLINGGRYQLLTIPLIGGQSIQGAVIEEVNDSCSLAVIGKSYTHGWPTRIQSPYLTLHITTDLPLWISFDPLPSNPCTTNPQWIVKKEEELGEAVMLGDSDETPFPFSDWFYIKPYDSAECHYKLTFCHENGECGHVAEEDDSHGNKRLVVTQDETIKPLVFTFVKETTSHISMIV